VQCLRERIKRNKSIVYNQIYNIVSYCVSILISLLTIKIVTTNIPPNDFGFFAYVLAILSLASITTITGFNKTIGGYIAKGFHGTVQKTLKISLKTGLLGIVFLLGFSFYYWMEEEVMKSLLFFIISLFFIPYTVFNRYSSILAGLEKFKHIMYFNILLKIIVFTSLFVLVIVFDKGIFYYGSAQIIVTSVLMYIFYLYSTRRLINNRVDPEFLRHSIIISLVGISGQVITPGIQLIVSDLFGPATLAIYVISSQIPNQLMGIIKPILHPVSVSLAKKSRINYYKSVFKYVPLTLLMGFLLYLTMFVVVDKFGYLVIGNEYIGVIYYVKLLGLVMLLAPTYSLLNSCLVFEKQNKAYAISFYTHQAIVVIGYIIYIGQYGIESIAYVNFVALMIQIIIMAFLIKLQIYKEERYA
jgi:O-antigen/teichoic acid export membrane protein